MRGVVTPNTFEGARLDRVTMRRRDPEWVAAQLADPSSRAVVAADAAVLVDGERVREREEDADEAGDDDAARDDATEEDAPEPDAE